jgi:hypothetical protein
VSETELRELDAWIAENVMGWELAKDEYHARMSLSKSYCISSDKTVCFGHQGQFSLFKPTTNPAAAMELLKKCGEQGILKGEFKLPVSIFRRGDLQWVVSENCEDAPEHEFYIVVEAETLELAICLFAKKLFTK